MSDFIFGFFLPMSVYLFVMSVTPGPNNTMLMASGLNFGFKRTIPHALGVVCGFTMLFSLVGLGLGKVFQFYPILNDVLKYLGAAYLLWLAWRIASAPVETKAESEHDNAESERAKQGRPFTWLEAAAFQLLNVKAWIAVIAGNSTYVTGGDWLLKLAVSDMAILFIVGLSCVIWMCLGVGLKKFLYGRAMKIVNIILALLLVGSIAPVIL